MAVITRRFNDLSSLRSRKRLKDIIAHMRERIHGRIGNKSDNAFKLRKFAKMYDTSHSGMVSPFAKSDQVPVAHHF